MKEASIDTIHFIAIGGTGVAPLACLLKGQGYQVRGSDGHLYPPMSTFLERQGIVPLLGFDAAHLQPLPDLVIVSNAVPRSNPEAVETERLGLSRMSMPEALSRFVLKGRRPLVITGTHGKTTTTSLAAHVYSTCRCEPGYLIGGLPLDLPSSFAAGEGPRFLIEGDEYNAAYFDRGPKFLHYRPETVILTGVEHDHVDLYPDGESFRAAFADLIALLPEDGLLVADGDTAEVRALTAQATCKVVHYGLGEENDLRPCGAIDWRGDGTRFAVADPQHGSVDLELGVVGEHNVRNALAVWAVARRDGLPVDAVVEAISSFRGVRRRLEEVGSAGGVTFVDDFAHHPTEIETTIAAVRQRYVGRRVVVVFEPRSLTAGRSFFFDAYRRAFAGADVVLLAPIFHFSRLADDERIDLDRLAAALSDDATDARTFASIDTVFDAAVTAVESGDVVVAMSSGHFDGLLGRIQAVLA